MVWADVMSDLICIVGQFDLYFPNTIPLTCTIFDLMVHSDSD